MALLGLGWHSNVARALCDDDLGPCVHSGHTHIETNTERDYYIDTTEVVNFGTATVGTNLASAITASATTMPLVSASGFPSTSSSGFVVVDGEQIAYSGIIGSTLTGLTRGTLGSAAATHASGTVVHFFRRLTSAELIGAVQLGAAVWNEQGNSGTFRYMGTTSAGELEVNDPACLGDDTSRVYFNHAATPSFDPDGDVESGACVTLAAQAVDRCSSRRFNIFVQSHEYSQTLKVCVPIDWVNRAAEYGTADIAGTLAHEFGHTLGVGHPPEPKDPTPTQMKNCVMRSEAKAATHRDLYELDLQCSRECGGDRSYFGAYKIAVSGASFGAKTLFTGSDSIVKAASGITFDGSTARFTAAYRRATGVVWDEDANGTYQTLTNPSLWNGVGFMPIVFREDGSLDRVWYSYWDDAGPALQGTETDADDYVFTSVHQMRQILSTDEFVAAQTAGYMTACSTMSGSLTCATADRKRINTAKNPAVAWWLDPSGVGYSVTAWVHQDHSTGGGSNEIKLAVGYVDSWTLPKPTTTSFRTSVSPGLACYENFSSSWDCILAYVPVGDITNEVKIRRFSIAWGTGPTFDITFDSTEYSATTRFATTHQIAAWYSTADGKFVLAAKDLGLDEIVSTRTSTTGTSWAFGSSLEYSIHGPTAASAWRGATNQLVITQ